MTTTSSPGSSAERPDDPMASHGPESADQQIGVGATGDDGAPLDPEAPAQPEPADEQPEDDVEIPREEFARSPHQWSMPVHDPTSDASLYRQIIGYLGPPPTRKRPRALVVGCGVMVTLLVALMGLSGFYALRLARAQVSQRESSVSAAATIALFCEAAQNRDYSSAYRFMSPAFQRRMPVATFVALNETHDVTDGAITSCTARTDLLHASIPGSHANVTMEVARGRTVVGTITLARGAQGWRIDTLDPMLELD